MTTSWRYEFKKGKVAEDHAGSRQMDHCIYRNLLQEGHKHCGVEVYDLLTGPMRNPAIQIVEDHTRRRLLSKVGIPVYGGICKYVKSCREEFCQYCSSESDRIHSAEIRAKEMKWINEVNYLFKNIERIRGKQETAEKASTKDSCSCKCTSEARTSQQCSFVQGRICCPRYPYANTEDHQTASPKNLQLDRCKCRMYIRS